jgi:hypothetical protein
LAYDIANTLMTWGRQKLTLDNGRFIGTDDWRQNDNTVSGFTLTNESLNYTRISAGMLHRSEGVAGADAESFAIGEGHQDVDANYLHIKYRGFLNSFLSLYYLDIDNNDGNDQWDSATQGIRYAGAVDNEPALEYAVEYAVQNDKADNPNHYRASYFLIEGAVTMAGVKLGWGREMLGADGNGFFVVPLGSKDAFQGWSNPFRNGGLGNVPGGIVDNYLTLGYVWGKDAELIFKHHTFDSDDSAVGGGNLGKEWGLHLRQTWQNYRYSIGYTDYSADRFADDSRTLWLSIGANFSFGR